MTGRPAVFGFVALCVAAAGCDSGPRFAEVSGTLRLKGGPPLGNVMVEFLPDPAAGASGPRSSGVTDADGRFRLTTDDQRPGAAVGRHRVVLRDLKMLGDGYKPARQREDEMERRQQKGSLRSRIPASYTDAARTALHVEVKEGPQEIALEVTDR